MSSPVCEALQFAADPPLVDFKVLDETVACLWEPASRAVALMNILSFVFGAMLVVPGFVLYYKNRVSPQECLTGDWNTFGIMESTHMFYLVAAEFVNGLCLAGSLSNDENTWIAGIGLFMAFCAFCVCMDLAICTFRYQGYQQERIWQLRAIAKMEETMERTHTRRRQERLVINVKRDSGSSTTSKRRKKKKKVVQKTTEEQQQGGLMVEGKE